MHGGDIDSQQAACERSTGDSRTYRVKLSGAFRHCAGKACGSAVIAAFGNAEDILGRAVKDGDLVGVLPLDGGEFKGSFRVGGTLPCGLKGDGDFIGPGWGRLLHSGFPGAGEDYRQYCHN